MGKKGNDSWDLLNRDVDEVDVGVSPPPSTFIKVRGEKDKPL